MLHCSAPGHGKSFCWLVVGCLNDDSLLLSRHINVASLTHPVELAAPLRSKVTGDLRIVAAVLCDKVIGGDTVSPVTYTVAEQAALRQVRPGKVLMDLTNTGASPTEGLKGDNATLPFHAYLTPQSVLAHWNTPWRSMGKLQVWQAGTKKRPRQCPQPSRLPKKT